MSELNFDEAKNLTLTVRYGGSYTLRMTVLLDGNAFDFTGKSVDFYLLRNKSSLATDTLKNSAVDTNYINITGNVITVSLKDDLTLINPMKYFWVLRYIDENSEPHYWLLGDYKVITGYSDEDVTDTLITFNITETIGSITLTLLSSLNQIWCPLEDIVGTKNGINATFTLPQNYVDGGEIIILDGTIRTKNVDYTRTGLTIVMLTDIPASSSNFKSMGVKLT